MKRRAFLGLGASSIGVGTLYGTGAFSSVSAGRGISVSAAGDSEGALLGIDNVNDENSDPVFTNNTGLYMQVELSDIDSDTDVTFDPGSFTLSPENDSGDSVSVELDTSDNATSADVKVTAHLFEGDPEINGTKRGKITLQRNFSVNSVVFGIDGGLTSAGNSGKLDFKISTTGDISATLESYSVETKNELGEDDYLRDETNSEFDGEDLPVTFNNEIDVTLKDFTNGLTINNCNFTDPQSPDTDIVITLQTGNFGDAKLGIDAEPFAGGNAGVKC